MATLERRVQVLFDPEQYQAVEAAAERDHLSVGAWLREAADDRLARTRLSKQEALRRLFASADQAPGGPVDWAADKEALETEYYSRDGVL